MMLKLFSSALSVVLVFTSVTPSLAQLTQSRRTVNSPFKVENRNALGDAFQRQVAKTLEQMEDRWWVTRAEKLVSQQCAMRGLPCMVETLFKAQEAAPKQDILQAVVCDQDELDCVPALAYAWGSIHYATKNLLYFQEQPIIETAPHLVTLITEYGVHSEEDRQAVRTYFYKLIREADSDCDSGLIQSKWEVGSQERRANARHANAEQAKRCKAEIAVLPALAMLEKTPYEKHLAAKEVYSLLKKYYDNEQGAEVIYSAITALGVLDTQEAYRYLEHFLTQDTIPSTVGNIWEGMWSPGKSVAQNSLRATSNIRGGNSRYLNRINEQFQYLDKTEAKRQGFTNTIWRGEGRQYPYGNILEEIGVFLGEQSARNAQARALAKKLVHKANAAVKTKTNAAGIMHYPVILGILEGWKKHDKQFIYEPSPELLSLFYKGDWFDINEGTQRRIHQRAYEFGQLRGYTGWQAPSFDKEKKERYIYNDRLLKMGQAADVVAPLFVAEGLFRVIPALMKGIPSAVRVLRGRSTTLVGTKNYLQRVPPSTLAKVKAKAPAPVAQEIPQPVQAAKKPVVAKQGANLKTVPVDSKTIQWVPEGYTAEEFNLGQPTPTTYASQGAPVANTAKVQPLSAPQVVQPAAQAQPTSANVVAQNAQYIRGKVTNALGQEVEAWVPNPGYVPPPTIAARPAHQLSFLDKVRLQWALNIQPAFSNMFKFGKSGYGMAALGPGLAPVSSEAAIARAGQAVELVNNLRFQQATFVAEDVLRGGAGASLRTGVVNPGGIISQRLAQSAVKGMQTTTPNMTQLLAGTSAVAGYASPLSFAKRSGVLYSSVLPISPNLLQRIGTWIRNVGYTPSARKMADEQAQNVLGKRQPMLAQLRDVVMGAASDKYKRQALVKLYHQGIFTSFLQHQPKAVRDLVILATDDRARGEALFVLYRARYLDGVLKGIANIQAQGSVLAQLEEVINQDGWADLAKSAYQAEDMLPLQNENFAGAVSGVPEADLKKIGDTVRTEQYAVDNMSTGRNTSKGVYYENNIPFYYRNSKGELSSQPVGILTQVPANLYGRILSRLRLASQPGLTIPEGFVLALDEQGQWKFFIPKGNLAVVENNLNSRKILAHIKKNGSARVTLDTNYTTTDLLAMAHLLENNPTLNIELALNTPHSLSQFLTGHAFFVGNDAGNTLTGPFKDSLQTVKGFVNTLTNVVSGIGYATPIAGGYAMPTMSRWGNVKTTKVIYGSAAGALAFSLTVLGMYGTVKPETLPLIGLAIPTVALVLGASLANSFIPTFLNFYKDPAARTAANLDFSTKKQVSRLGLSGIITLAKLLGGNWTVVVPVGLALLAGSYGLFINTPMYKGEATRLATLREEAEKEKERWNALSPEQQEAEKRAKAEAEALQNEIEEQYVAEYEAFRDNHPEMKASKSRVKMVYASYAASLMVLGQSANAAFGEMGQGFITLCMGATLGTRLLATWLVKKNIMTDDQLTGLSLPTLALTGLSLALLPYSGIAAGVAGLAGVLHYMATAVPGQLDAARMQNIVTAEMQQRKQNILNRSGLTESEKETEVAALTAEEKVWSAQASKDYSLYNARGLWGIITATGAALLFADIGPQWTKDVLQWVSNWYKVASPALSLNRLLFLYSGGVASVLALKNTDLTADALRFFGKKTAVTSQAIAAQKITPKVFGINAKNAQIQLGNLNNKTMKDLEPMLVEYGVSSEQKMTKILQQLQVVHNRLVAINEVLGDNFAKGAFEREANMLKKFETILNQNDLSVMLQREFAALKQGLFKPGTQEVLEHPQYVEEGLYNLPENYQRYEAARIIVGEMDQMAYSLALGDQHGVDYDKFIDYMNRAREDLLQYERVNPADAVRVGQLRQKIDRLGRWLLMQDEQHKLLDPLETDSPQIKKGKQALRDMLAGYSD